MKGYRRFVAYVYEYRRGKKEENCGYIRVEARDHTCSVETHLKCAGLPGQVKGKIYGFVRHGDKTEGYFLHECKTVPDTLECSFETRTDRMGNHPVSLSDLGGMMILTEGGAFFGTEWDDHPIVPEAFFIHQEPKKTPAAQQAETIEETAAQKTLEQETLGQETLGQETLEQETLEQETKVQETSGPETEAQETSGPETEVQETSGPETEVQETSGPETEAQETSGQETKLQETAVETDPELEITEVCEPACQRRQDSIILNRMEADTPDACETREFLPFPDGEISECRKIQPRDFGYLHPRDRGLKNNRFVSYSYNQFGYLLIGQLPNGRYILGLPGGYDPQERFMAGTFGFPYFKQSPEIELQGVPGGYWYRLINTPNFYQ